MREPSIAPASAHSRPDSSSVRIERRHRETGRRRDAVRSPARQGPAISRASRRSGVERQRDTPTQRRALALDREGVDVSGDPGLR
jgi:hypothetical protein